MAYDYFSDTSFDLNHDGKIDANEAAYIYETFFNEDNEKQEPFEEMDCYESYNQHCSSNNSSSSNDKSYLIDFEELRKAAEKENYHKNLFIIVVVSLLLLVFPSSPGVGLFVGGILLILKWSKGF